MSAHRRDSYLEASKVTTGGLRAVYRTLELPGRHPLKDAHAALDAAVLAAYGFDAKKDLLAQLLELNLTVAAIEKSGGRVTAPGVPPSYGHAEKFITEDCIRPRRDRGGKRGTSKVSKARRGRSAVLPEQEVAAAERDDGLAALLVQAVGGDLVVFELGHRTELLPRRKRNLPFSSGVSGRSVPRGQVRFS